VTITDQSVLVTGGAGFIGSYLISQFLAKSNLTVIDDFLLGDASYVPDDARSIKKRSAAAKPS
jgi:UDP-glucose 4-epimerase